MSKLWLLSGFLCLVAGCASNGMHHGKEDAEGDESDEVKVAFADVPTNVRAVFFSESQGATPATVEKQSLKGKEVYEADVRIDGKNHEIVVGADGRLVHNKIDDEADEKPAMKTAGAKEEDEDDEKPAMKK